jgi:glycosyltransferase involved in cell wall biosynthesis
VSAPAFSVLMAAYNQAEWVEETLDTVAAQRCTDYELVVVDDGSTDGTGARVAEWMERFRRAHPNRAILATTGNHGQSAAMEHGFSLCTGRYVCLLDSDDRWVPEKLARLADAAAAHPGAGMIVHPLYVIDSEGRRTGDVRPMRARLSTGDLREEIRRTSRIVAPASSGMSLRSDVFARLVPMPTRGFRTAADMYLALGAGLLAPVLALDEPLGEYRMHADGQHVRTMLSPDGLGRWVDLQNTLLEHFGLEHAARRSNSYFVRHEFALAKLRGGAAEQSSAYARLLGATWRDESFGVRERVLFTGYWTACMLSPRPVFRRLWRAFQMKQTGFDRIGLGSTRAAGI